MPSLFGGVTGRTSATLFEIRLENDFVLLRGGENEAASQLLRGVVVLCLPASLKVEDVHLKMSGQLKIGWTDQRIAAGGTPMNNHIHRTTKIFSHKWAPFVGGSGPASSSRGTVLHAGNYEWPFELAIPGSMTESVEGLPDSYITYKLKATVARGKLAYDLHAWKPVRIVRTLDPSALELVHAMSISNVWTNKIEYEISIPHKAVVFGTSIPITMKCTSLLKGLRIGTITCVLLENHDFTIPKINSSPERHWEYSREIDSRKFEVTEDHYTPMMDGSDQDGYVLEEKIPLPKTLTKCLQDTDVHGIKIRHKVKFNIALHNPDGHISELRATLPVHIFISPNMPLTSDGQLIDQTPITAQAGDVAQHAPPTYQEHVFDQLYAGFEQSGLMTPAPQSGMNTPFSVLSRVSSRENLACSNGVGHANGAVPPAALSSILQSLNLNSGSRSSNFRRLPRIGTSGTSTPHMLTHAEGDLTGYCEGHIIYGPYSGQSSTPLSRRASEEATPDTTGGALSPERFSFSNLGNLTKVPSYGTAIRTPVRRFSNDGLPNYATAVSQPPSPSRIPSTDVMTSAESNSNRSVPGARSDQGGGV